MAKFVFAMNQTLDGYVDHTACVPSKTLFRYFVERIDRIAGSVYGRRMYEVMRYWDEEQAEWTQDEHDFAAVWRKQHKWVVSSTMKSVGPNATLISKNFEAEIRVLKAKHEGEFEIAGPEWAGSLTALGLIDEYRLYFHPVVLGAGKPYFSGARPPLRFVASKMLDDAVIRLTYAPV